jgi:hypothetical protein
MGTRLLSEVNLQPRKEPDPLAMLAVSLQLLAINFSELTTDS